VRETRFGTWFLSTGIWKQYVLGPALSELERLLAADRRGFATVLDAGCGEGSAFPLLEQRFRPAALLGIEIDPRLAERARAAAGRCACRAQARVGNVAKLDLPDASVDLVFCHQTIHHVVDQAGALQEFHRVLRPGGVLLLAESCRTFIRSLWVRALFRHPMAVQKVASAYLALLHDVGFEFGPEHVATARPWWSEPDLGLRARVGRPVRADGEPTQLHVVAFRAA
jgi:SAM-dependent methyltransferase